MAGRNFDRGILSEGIVKFDFMTSLQNIVMAKIMSSLWMNKSSLVDIANFIHSDLEPERRKNSDSWQKVKNNIVAKVSKIPLPDYMTEKLNNIVPVVGNSILNWIRYHEYILNTNEYSAVDQINHIAWTTRGKIDYAQTTKNILADKDNCLCDDHKYKLACINCLKDEIAVLAPNVVNKYYLDSVKIHMHPMVYFWTAQITGDDTKLFKHYRDFKRNVSINGYILFLLIKSSQKFNRTFNEVPIIYMLDKICIEEKARHITQLIKQLKNHELIYTLLSGLHFRKQQEVFKKCSDTILLGIFNDWLWEEYFLPIALHILDKIKLPTYLSILQHLNEKMSKCFQKENNYLFSKYNYIFKELVQKGVPIFADEFPILGNDVGLEYCVLSLQCCQDMDVMELLLNRLNEEQKKHVMFDWFGVRRCVEFIKDDKWDLLERFIKLTLSSEEDINSLKDRLDICFWDDIIYHFLKYEAYDKLECYMSWSQSVENINKIGKDLAYRKYEATLESVISNDKSDFSSLENHFKWCANGDLELINQFKAKFPMSYSETIIKKLIQNDKYEFLDQFLNWCFLSNQKHIVQFKSNMYKYDNLMSIFVPITMFLVQKDTSFKRLDKFVDWLFPNEQEVNEFKMWLLYPPDKVCSLCSTFLVENQFELADKFIEWCLPSTEEISLFKMCLMLSKEFMVFFEIHNNEKPYLHFLIEWFNPSEEMVETLKNVYPVEECPNSSNKLLKDFLENRNSLSENNKEYIKQIHVNSAFKNSHNRESREWSTPQSPNPRKEKKFKNMKYKACTLS